MSDTKIELKLDPVMTTPDVKKEIEISAAQEAAQASADAAKKAQEIDDSMLNDDEKKAIAAFSKQIDLTNSSQIIQYGASAQQKVAQFSESALENVKTKDLGDAPQL